MHFPQMGEYSWGDNSRAPGSHLNNMKSAQPTTVSNPRKSFFWKFIFLLLLQPPHMMDSITAGHNSIPASPTYHKMRTSSGDSCRLRNKLMQIGQYFQHPFFLPQTNIPQSDCNQNIKKYFGRKEIYPKYTINFLGLSFSRQIFI